LLDEKDKFKMEIKGISRGKNFSLIILFYYKRGVKFSESKEYVILSNY